MPDWSYGGRLNKAARASFIASLESKLGQVRSLPDSQSLLELVESSCRIYVRYSRVHAQGGTFYGLRQNDLRELEGRLSFLVFLWDGQAAPLIVPFADYEEVFRDTTPARDGQYKTQVYISDEGTELYIARAGRFNVDAHLGWQSIERAISARRVDVPDLTHSQVQTLLGAIGVLKKFDVWIPVGDRGALDWSMSSRFSCVRALPYDDTTCNLLGSVDAIWLRPGSNEVVALYEVEHSTPIYSGLLRLNDVRLTLAYAPRLAIVSNDVRRAVFTRQLRRPTFQRSGLSENCTFMEYGEVFEWYRRAKNSWSGRLS